MISIQTTIPPDIRAGDSVIMGFFTRFQYSINSTANAQAGNCVIMQFQTDFTKRRSVIETVTFVQEKDEQWRAVGYYHQVTVTTRAWTAGNPHTPRGVLPG